jgi:hypothetical protein
MTDYIQGPAKGKVQYIKNAGGIQLELVPQHLAPTGSYVCVVDNGAFEAAAVVNGERDLEDFCHPSDMRPKWWLHVDDDTLKKLLYEGGNVG